MHCHVRHVFGRHHGGRGFGSFGRGFMEGGGMGSRAFGMGRKLASVDLQLLILGLLAEKPRHGYEIIKALDERSKGFYIPSPGMVYPALTYLEEIGYASVAPEGTRKLYSATDAGRKHLADNRAALETLLAQLQQIGRRMQKFRHALQPEAPGADAAHEADPSPDAAAPELQVARFDLKLALAAKADAPRAEQLRIAAILRQAATDIRGQ